MLKLSGHRSILKCQVTTTTKAYSTDSTVYSRLALPRTTTTYTGTLQTTFAHTETTIITPSVTERRIEHDSITATASQGKTSGSVSVSRASDSASRTAHTVVEDANLPSSMQEWTTAASTPAHGITGNIRSTLPRTQATSVYPRTFSGIEGTTTTQMESYATSPQSSTESMDVSTGASRIVTSHLTLSSALPRMNEHGTVSATERSFSGINTLSSLSHILVGTRNTLAISHDSSSLETSTSVSRSEQFTPVSMVTQGTAQDKSLINSISFLATIRRIRYSSVRDMLTKSSNPAPTSPATGGVTNSDVPLTVNQESINSASPLTGMTTNSDIDSTVGQEIINSASPEPEMTTHSDNTSTVGQESINSASPEPEMTTHSDNASTVGQEIINSASPEPEMTTHSDNASTVGQESINSASPATEMTTHTDNASTVGQESINSASPASEMTTQSDNALTVGQESINSASPAAAMTTNDDVSSPVGQEDITMASPGAKTASPPAQTTTASSEHSVTLSEGRLSVNYVTPVLIADSEVTSTVAQDSTNTALQSMHPTRNDDVSPTVSQGSITSTFLPPNSTAETALTTGQLVMLIIPS